MVEVVVGIGLFMDVVDGVGWYGVGEGVFDFGGVDVFVYVDDLFVEWVVGK